MQLSASKLLQTSWWAIPAIVSSKRAASTALFLVVPIAHFLGPPKPTFPLLVLSAHSSCHLHFSIDSIFAYYASATSSETYCLHAAWLPHHAPRQRTMLCYWAASIPCFFWNQPITVLCALGTNQDAWFSSQCSAISSPLGTDVPQVVRSRGGCCWLSWRRWEDLSQVVFWNGRSHAKVETGLRKLLIALALVLKSSLFAYKHSLFLSGCRFNGQTGSTHQIGWRAKPQSMRLTTDFHSRNRGSAFTPTSTSALAIATKSACALRLASLFGLMGLFLVVLFRIS